MQQRYLPGLINNGIRKDFDSFTNYHLTSASLSAVSMQQERKPLKESCSMCCFPENSQQATQTLWFKSSSYDVVRHWVLLLTDVEMTSILGF